jgi:hypothetical protein
MDVPIYIDGVAEGTVTLMQTGSAWTVAAQLRDVGRVVRLRLYGKDGQSLYLGVPVPEGGGLRLCRRLSAQEGRQLPPDPAYAGEKPLSAPHIQPVQPSTTGRHVLWQGGKPYFFG